MDFLKEIKQGINKIKDKLTKTELQRLLKEATSNEHCHANVSLLDEISSKTHNYNDFRVIVAHVLKKLDCKKEKWRKILKSLFLIEHILKTGSPNFYDSMRSEISKLKYLHSFSFVDTNKSDKGETIREKSRIIVDLLEHKDKLKEEREKYSKWKSRIEGVSSSGKMGSTSYTSYSGDNFASSVSSSNYSNTYGGSSKNRRDSPDLSSSSSEDEKDNKKKNKKSKGNKKDSSGEGASSDEDKNKKNKKTQMQSSQKDEEENNGNNSLKPTTNISLKKPNSSANRKAEAESLFQMQQGSSSNQNKGNSANLMSIDDLLGGPVSNNPVPVNNQTNSNSFLDSNIFGAPVNNNTNNANNLNANIIDFGFVANNNNPNSNQAQNSNANTDLFNMGNAGNMQSNVNQASKPTGGFNTDDLLKNMYSNNNNNSSNNAFNNAFGNPSSQNANAFQNMQFNNPNMNVNPNMMGGFNNSFPGTNAGFNYNMNMNNNNNFNTNTNASAWGYNAQSQIPTSSNNNNMNSNMNKGFNSAGNNSANFNFNFGNNSTTNNNTKKKFDDDEFCEVVEDDSKNANKNNTGKTDIMSLLSGIGSDKVNNQNKQNSSANNNSNTNFNFY